MEPLISVIIPAYNCEEFIEDTINSVLSQTYKNIEIIVVDDGSKDKTSELIKAMSEMNPSIKYFYQSNSGVSMTRNKAINESKGEYVAFIDGDDLWYDTKLQKQVDKLVSGKYDACFCGHISWYMDSEKKISNIVKFENENIAYEYIKSEMWPQTSTWIVRRDTIIDNDIKFTPKCNWGEDVEFFTKVVSLSKVCFVDECLSVYRIRENNSLSSDFSKKQVYYLNEAKKMWERLEQWFNTLDNNNLNEVQKAKIISYIRNYRIPFLLINTLWHGIKEKELKEKYANIYKQQETIDCINNFKPKFTRVDIKTFIKSKLLKFKV
ncbi:glycosyltransferase family 2 protein [Clostridium omnivorum]|uniref:Beta-1,3-N-acetylglucosaminyltransferase n=1 Tax=Clostridium omnivorum TaxID=1604902 RepID=A0ABQ5N3U8_9CLOT|nr:glycosyltransferase family 2 protein [Clostridium sp. E14]GLC29725.1 beta-1,3-N-acetylglucosaminyltransferase [Clostridium sp. E14]